MSIKGGWVWHSDPVTRLGRLPPKASRPALLLARIPALFLLSGSPFQKQPRLQWGLCPRAAGVGGLGPSPNILLPHWAYSQVASTAWDLCPLRTQGGQAGTSHRSCHPHPRPSSSAPLPRGGQATAGLKASSATHCCVPQAGDFRSLSIGFFVCQVGIIK